jgi:iron complex outermembrane receptor protein
MGFFHVGASQRRVFQRGRRALVMCVVVSFAMNASAVAQQVPRDAKLEAKAHFVSGQSHYNLNELSEALADFKDAYRLYPDPVFLFNGGQCERQLGHFEEAIRFYRSFLREQPKAPNRQDVVHKIEEMEAAIKSRAAEPDKPSEPPVPALPEAAKVEPVAPIMQPPAEPSATPAAPSTPVAPTFDDSRSSRIDLTTPAPEPAAAPTPAFYQHWWFWTAAGVLAVGAGIGIYAATSGKSLTSPNTDLGTKKVF